MYHNFVRIHKTLRTTPAVAAGVTNRRWEIGDIVGVLAIMRQAMPANQDEYEKKTRDEIIAKLYEIKRISASIDAAAKAGRPLPIAANEFLKKISIAIAECQSVVDEHAHGDRFSDITLRTVSKALKEMHHSIDSLTLHAAMENIRSQK
ncbi:MAG: hypothetical protein ACLQAT_19715 [Candidatus Binataceae bacterium]